MRLREVEVLGRRGVRWIGPPDSGRPREVERERMEATRDWVDDSRRAR